MTARFLGGLAVKVGNRLTLAISLVLLPAWTAPAQETQVLCGFEDAEPPKTWEYQSGTARIVEEGATEGDRALEITFDPKGAHWGAYLNSFRLPGDWSAHDALVLDVFNPNDEPTLAYVLVGDRAWQEKGASYWNRHNGQQTFAPGRTEWVIPVRGLYRGEAGSRNNDIKRNIDPASIVRVDLGFGRKGAAGRIVIDNLRLVKTAAPKGVWAFDFGPPSQSLMLGWTAVAHDTGYTPERGYGWGPRGGTPWNGAARDTTFGTMLLADFCEAGGYNFHVDVPAGRYRLTVFYENSGYWGGEQAMHGERRILVQGREVWQESRPDGPAHALYRFEDVEPIGVDIWDTYMAPELARPARFEADATSDGLTLRFEADRVWGSKVAAVAVHQADDEKAAAWLAGEMDKLAEEFRGKAVCLDAPAPPFDIPAPWREVGLVAWPVRIEDEVTPNSAPQTPAESPQSLKLRRLAVRGEFEPFSVALRPLRDLGECRVELEPFKGPGKLDGKVEVVRYQTSRGFGTISYHVRPHTLRPVSTLDLPKDVTRQLVVTVLVRRGTPAGAYQGGVVLEDSSGKVIWRVPLELTVSPATLDRRTDYLMGFFGLLPPGLVREDRRGPILEQTLRMLREHGMNAVSGGPSWRLEGWRDGQPVIDFGEMDRFFALLKKFGFRGPVNGYGGLRFAGLHQRYEKGQTGAKVEAESGLDYEEALMRAWRAVDRHAREADWPLIFYAMCDETRVRDKAERELEFMRMMGKVSAAFPQTVHTSGSYSVRFAERPTDRDDLLYWHQRFFEALDVSSLNHHDPGVMSEADRLGREIQIYNQGRTRYSFGLYQWSEYTKGVRARWQWHLNILHGYQFFDLDGREPDTAMLCYGRDSIYPTIHFERCREGAEDFYLYQTLRNLIEKRQTAGDRSEAVGDAVALLEGLVAEVKLNQRNPPKGYDADLIKAKVARAIQSLTGS